MEKGENMFSLNTNVSQNNVRVYVTHGNEKLEFPLTPVIKTFHKKLMTTDMQYDLVNAYVKYKGEAYEKKLFEAYKTSREEIMNTNYFYGLLKEDTRQLPTEIIDSIVALLDLDDMIRFVKEVLKIQPLNILHDEFLDIMETDGMGTRNQTYVKEDYLKFIGFSIYIKIMLIPVIMYGHVKQQFINQVNKEYLLLHFITKYPIMDSEPMRKVINYIEEVLNKSADELYIVNSFIFSKSIPKDEIPTYMLGLVIFQKVFLYAHKADAETDSTDKAMRGNVISNMYSFIIDALEKQGSTAKTIKNKELMDDKDGDDKESILESYRTVSNLSYGFVEEFLWATKDIDTIIEQLPEEQRVHVNREILDRVKVNAKRMKTEAIQDEHIFILTTIFKSLIDSRAIYYLNIDNIINLISVAFAYLWSIDSKPIALLLMSKKEYTEGDVMTFSAITSKERVPKEYKEELDRFYPFKLPHTDEPKNLVMETIINLSQDIYQNNWTQLCSPELVKEGLTVSNNLKDENIKLELVKFVINNERLINKEELHAAV